MEEGGGVHTMKTNETLDDAAGGVVVVDGVGNGYSRNLNEERKKWMRRRWREGAWADEETLYVQLPFVPPLHFSVIPIRV